MLIRMMGKAGFRGVSPLIFAVLCGLSLSACFAVSEPGNTLQSNEKTIIYLVRHAEKQDGDNDPGLTTAGRVRATTLAEVLEAHTVHKLWSSDYARTRQTLSPLSEQQQVPVTVYDAHDSNALVTTIMQNHSGQTHVIAGHSNTVPALVDLFEAWPNAPGAKRPNLEHHEYDRLYVVTVVSDRPGIVDERRY